MITLRANIRELHIIENKAAEKVGMRFLLLEDRKLFGKKSNTYINSFVHRIQIDIFPEMIGASLLGSELRKAVFHAEDKK